MTVSAIQYDAKKFEELLLYVAEESADDPNFGKTKLNKILFYADFLAYGALGKPITGADYQRRPYGPVPRQIVAARSDLVARGEASMQVVERFGFAQERLIALRPANASVFSQAEKQLIDEVIEALWDKSGVGASDLSHREPGWRLAAERESIPYSAVFLSPRDLTADDVRRGQEIFTELQKAA